MFEGLINTDVNKIQVASVVKNQKSAFPRDVRGKALFLRCTGNILSSFADPAILKNHIVTIFFCHETGFFRFPLHFLLKFFKSIQSGIHHHYSFAVIVEGQRCTGPETILVKKCSELEGALISPC